MIRPLLFLLLFAGLAQAAPSPFTQAEALKNIPKEALFLAVMENPQALLEGLAYTTFRNQTNQIEELRKDEEFQAFLKFSSPENWPAWGIDGAAPAGLAVFGPRPIGVFFFGLSDAAQAERELMKLFAAEGSELKASSLGAGRLLSANHSLNIVIRDRNLYLVFSDDRAYEQLSHQILNQGELNSVLTVASFKEAIAPLGRSSIAAYLDLRALLNQISGEFRMGKEELFIRGLLAPFGALTAQATVQPDGLSIGLSLAILKETLPRKFFLNEPKAPALYSALDGPPLMLETIRVDLIAIWEFFNSLALITGDKQELDSIDQELRGFLGLEMKEALSIFSGSFGFALRGDLSQAKGSFERALKVLEGVISLGLKDEAKMQGLLGKIIQHPALAGMLKVAGAGWSVQLPEGLNLNLKIKDRQLLIGNHPLKAQGEHTLLKGLAPRSRALLSRLKLFGSFLFDWRLLGLISADEVWEREPHVIPPSMQENPGYRAKAKQLNSLYKEAAARDRAEEALQIKERDAFFPLLGQLALSGGMSERGFELGLEWSCVPAKELMIASIQAIQKAEQQNKKHWKRYLAFEQKINKLQEELRQIEAQ